MHDQPSQQPEKQKAGIKVAAEKRNAKLRTPEYREHMAAKTREFNENNPDAAAARQAKKLEWSDKRKALKAECLDLLRKKLVYFGAIRAKFTNKKISPSHLAKLKKRGLAMGFPNGLSATIEEWEQLRKDLTLELEKLLG